MQAIVPDRRASATALIYDAVYWPLIGGEVAAFASRHAHDFDSTGGRPIRRPYRRVIGNVPYSVTLTPDAGEAASIWAIIDRATFLRPAVVSYGISRLDIDVRR